MSVTSPAEVNDRDLAHICGRDQDPPWNAGRPRHGGPVGNNRADQQGVTYPQRPGLDPLGLGPPSTGETAALPLVVQEIVVHVGVAVYDEIVAYDLEEEPGAPDAVLSTDAPTREQD